MQISEVMTKAPLFVESTLRVREALAAARERGIEHLLVCDHGEVVGVACAQCELADAKLEVTTMISAKTTTPSTKVGDQCNAATMSRSPSSQACTACPCRSAAGSSNTRYWPAMAISSAWKF